LETELQEREQKLTEKLQEAERRVEEAERLGELDAARLAQEVDDVASVSRSQISAWKVLPLPSRLLLLTSALKIFATCQIVTIGTALLGSLLHLVGLAQRSIKAPSFDVTA
jgi:hypothetical protein